MTTWTRAPECPECGVALEGSGAARCEWCGQWLWIEVDTDGDAEGREWAIYRVTVEDPPDWREIEGDLRYHGGL